MAKRASDEEELEIAKCYASPYYFATTYLQVNGKPFTTNLSEEEFNEIYARMQNEMIDPYVRKEFGP